MPQPVLRPKSLFIFFKLDEDGTANYFETSQTKTDTPTLLVDTHRSHPTMKSGVIHRIHYRLNPTNAVTYTLRLWRRAVANNYANNISLLYESPPLQADDTDYDRAELMIPFECCDGPGILYFSIEWTGAPGVTLGFIDVSGEKIS
jgi:hypothetical protein